MFSVGMCMEFEGGRICREHVGSMRDPNRRDMRVQEQESSLQLLPLASIVSRMELATLLPLSRRRTLQLLPTSSVAQLW